MGEQEAWRKVTDAASPDQRCIQTADGPRTWSTCSHGGRKQTLEVVAKHSHFDSLLKLPDLLL